MTNEMGFLAALISKAESRLAHQAALVERMPSGSASREAVAACEVLLTLSDKVISLRRTRDDLASRQP